MAKKKPVAQQPKPKPVDPLKPKGLGRPIQDNTRPLPMYNPVATAELRTPEKQQELASIRAKQQAGTQAYADKEKARRKAVIAKSNTEGGFKNSAVAEKMRLFPNDATGLGEVFDDYLNPLRMVGHMADNIGHSKNAKELAINTAIPVGFGALEALAFTKGTPKNNLVPPKNLRNVEELLATDLGTAPKPKPRVFPNPVRQEVNKLKAPLQYGKQDIPGNHSFFNSDEIILGNRMDEITLKEWKKLSKEYPDLHYKDQLEMANKNAMNELLKNQPDISPDEILKLTLKRIQGRLGNPNPNEFYQGLKGRTGARALTANDTYFGQLKDWNSKGFNVAKDNVLLNDVPGAKGTVLSPNMINVRPEAITKANWASKAMGVYRKELPETMKNMQLENYGGAEAFKNLKPNKNGGKIKGAWGASLGTDPYIGGPDPIKLDLNGKPLTGVNTTPSAGLQNYQPITMPTPIGGTTGFPNTDNPAFTNYPTLGTTSLPPSNPYMSQAIPMDPKQTGYRGPQQGQGALNSGQVPITPEADKNAIPIKKEAKKLSMPDGAASGGFTGQGILAGLEIASALMPPDKIRRRYVRPEDMQSYNPNQYGTGSQAISEYGNTLKGKKKKAFWGALIGVAVDKAKEVKKGIHQNIENAVAPILNIANNNAAEAARLDNLYLSGGVQDMSKLQPVQPLLPQQPQYPQYMAYGGEMKYKNGGDLKTYDGGNTSLNSYNPFDGGTFKFSGDSHEKGGIDISYKGQAAEVEGGETAFKDQQGDLKIMGNLIVPGTNMKYKAMSKLLSKKEEKAQKYIDRGSLLLNTASPTDPYESLSFNSGKAMAIGGLQKQKQIAEMKEHLGNMQEAHLEEIKEKKLKPKNSFKNGGAIYAEDGATASGDPIYEAMLAAAAKKYGVNLEHLQRLVTQESNFSAKAKSTKGALGVMQFTPETAKKYGVQDILSSEKTEDVYKVVDAGVKHFKELLDQNKGDYYLATAAYNGGQGAVDFVKKKLKKDDLTGVEWVEFMQNRNKTSPTKNRHAWQNETLKYVQNITGVEDIENIGQDFRQEYYGYKAPKPTDGMFNGTYKIPDFDYTPSPNQIQTVDPNYTPLDLKQPPPYNKPSNARGINPLQFLGEGYALATNQEEPVKAQLYNPELYQPYQVSFQDRLNENQATFNSVEKQLAYDPTSLSTLAGQKYGADSQVLAEEFRTNQAIANDITNKNVSLLNEAKFKNLGILDQQYVRQSQAKSNTKRVNQEALNSISSKMLQKEASNNQLRVYENLYQNYSFDPHTGKALFQGPKQGEEKSIDFGITSLPQATPAKTRVETKNGNTKTTQYYEDPNIATLRALGVQEKQFNNFKPKNLNYYWKNTK